ncbi:hypothetical protein GCM10025870_16830 [Agromyces marinus]|uniref:Uncharacterized protein n=1 Tax=Agromyces marinus TaxID=1389020 RepID=A0ABN6YB64_9MICO|nr:hypothetical protein [Agromyces marinus]BDZ54610.1 hypothetical protein GCM10025870_16830 [Agromyces marinus]
MTSHATRHRTALIVTVALGAALLITALLVGRTRVEGLVTTLPEVEGAPVALGLAAIAGVVLFASATVRGIAASRARARRRALEAVRSGDVSCGIRNRELVARLEELTRPGGRRPELPARFTIVADDAGIGFWSGGRRPAASRRSPGARCATSARTRPWPAARAFPWRWSGSDATGRASNCR